MTLNNSPVYNNGQGGIVNDGGTVTLNNSPVSGNTASSEGGSIYIYAGTVTLNKSPVSGNTPDQCSPVAC
ncbi:MAG: hypothetical protein ABSB99_11830 [Acidimicrobiales bacterium]